MRGPLRYLIGANYQPPGQVGCVVEVGYDVSVKPLMGESIAYCNLFNEKYSEQSRREQKLFGPYLHSSDTASDYGEGQIDPRGGGWERNLKEQFERRQRQGFNYIELDNPDAYEWPAVKNAIELAASYRLKVIAKNPLICDDGNPLAYVKHGNVFGIIVEKDSRNTCEAHVKLRTDAGKRNLPVWFVAFEGGLAWAKKRVSAIRELNALEMGVTYSARGEYTTCTDLYVPRAAPSP